METRKCKYCEGVIPSDKRADTKFCSNSCKANYWEQNKGKKQIPELKALPAKETPKPAGQPLEGLRGVLGDEPKKDVTDVKETSLTTVTQQISAIDVKKESQAYKMAFAAMKEAETEYLCAKEMYAKCTNNLAVLQREKSRLQNSDPIRNCRTSLDAQAIIEKLGVSAISPGYVEKVRQADMKINNLLDAKGKLETLLPAKEKLYEFMSGRLKLIPQYEIVKPIQPLLSLSLQKPMGQLPAAQQLRPEQAQVAEQKDEEKQTEPYTPASVQIQSNGKLISSRELREMNYKCLNFLGRWKELFGLPAVVFHLAVHGKPGEGKSTFCIQFADYLAKNFGHVVYVSGEEGFSKTLRDKVVNNKVDNPYLFFADISSCEQIPQEIEADKFHFIFIDSLDTLRIDAARLRELRKHYPQSAFITISQSTKDGKMRGSQEIIHDTDIALKVENGIATTTKNRYHPRGTEFQVFEAMEQKPAPKKAFGTLRNVI